MFNDRSGPNRWFEFVGQLKSAPSAFKETTASDVDSDQLSDASPRGSTAQTDDHDPEEWYAFGIPDQVGRFRVCNMNWTTGTRKLAHNW